MIDLLLAFLQIVIHFNNINNSNQIERTMLIEHLGKDTIEGRGGEEDL